MAKLTLEQMINTKALEEVAGKPEDVRLWALAGLAHTVSCTRGEKG